MTLRKKLIIGAGAGLLLIGAALIYEIVIPNVIAKNYNQQLHASAMHLQTTLDNTKSLTSVTRVFSKDSNNTLEDTKNEMNVLKTSLDKDKSANEGFKKSAKGLRKLPLSGYFGSYRQAKDTQAKSVAAASKLEGHITNYRELIDFLLVCNKIVFTNQSKTIDFSKLNNPDLNQTISTLKTNAQAEKETYEAFQKMTPPADIRSDSLQITALTGDVAKGLAAYAAALERGDQAAADAAFNGNNQALEKVGELNEKMRQTITSPSSPMKAMVNAPKLISDLKL